MRILITGIGMLTCIGAGVEAHRHAVSMGRSGMSVADDANHALPTGSLAGHVRVFEAGSPRRVWSFLQRAIDEALQDAGLTPASSSLSGCLLYVGSAHGDIDGWLGERRGERHAGRPWELSLRGGTFDASRLTVVSTACTASAVALGLAVDALRSGAAGMAVVAGAETLNAFLCAGFDSLRALTRGPCRPFDRARDGLVLGEGAAALVIETDVHARERRARGIVELAGYGFAADAAHLTAPDPSARGATHAVRQAMAEAGFVAPPDFINAHGTGTILNDRMECIALRRVFGPEAGRVAITSTKPLTGHLCGAAGVTEAALTAISLHTGIVPAITGFREPEAEFASLDFVRGPSRVARFKTAISMNSGFGGTNTALAFRRLPC